MTDRRTRLSLLNYLALTFAVSAVFYAWAFAGAPLGRVAPLLMWVPAAAAVVTQLWFNHTLAGLGWRPGSWRYVVFALLLPVIYCGLIYVPTWLGGLGRFEGSHFRRMLPHIPPALAIAVFLGLGEEIGWRGFLAPTLYRLHGFGWAGIGTGLIWGLWHVPLIVGGGYDAGTPLWYGIACFLVSVSAISVVLAWLRLRSRSLWPAAIYHGAHNLVIQGLFDRSTVDTGPTKWITTEFGVGLALVSILVAAYFWRRRGDLAAT